MKTIYIVTLFLYIYENYLHFNIILEINICANSNTTSGQCPPSPQTTSPSLVPHATPTITLETYLLKKSIYTVETMMILILIIRTNIQPGGWARPSGCNPINKK